MLNDENSLCAFLAKLHVILLLDQLLVSASIEIGLIGNNIGKIPYCYITIS